ncbi:sulfate ABC transporter substrate-binding protein [Anatilimnocola floriformis]|uniref:sulfate ABC transporter substrate-binding protein n=1 Tax=Anatilimnocola floriformis TaxID=2948575 RepID=UPI0020C2FA63|nr:sulfate ABC transporter substrate-binding protein [Anatilimnocola floriformis]
MSLHTSWSLRIFTCSILAIVGCSTAPSEVSPKDSAPAATPMKPAPAAVTILNASYDPTREFYSEFNQTFADDWKQKSGQEVTVNQSHAGSGKQARSVIDGLEADVVTLSVGYDLNAMSRKGLMSEDWQARLPNNSCPYTSTIVFLVRKGNPKGLRDWSDLTKPGVELVTPNPKTGGASRWCYLAAWGFALHRELGDWKALQDPARAAEVKQADEKARQFVGDLYRRVVVLDSGSRGSAQTFKNGIGDALLTWENEAFLMLKQPGAEYEMIAPSISILAEPAVAVVDKVVDKRKTREIAQAYLEYLYSAPGQQLVAKHFYRPAFPELIEGEQNKQFAPIKFFSIAEVFGGWDTAQALHFDDGGVYDQIYAEKK